MQTEACWWISGSKCFRMPGAEPWVAVSHSPLGTKLRKKKKKSNKKTSETDRKSSFKAQPGAGGGFVSGTVSGWIGSMFHRRLPGCQPVFVSQSWNERLQRWRLSVLFCFKKYANIKKIFKFKYCLLGCICGSHCCWAVGSDWPRLKNRLKTSGCFSFYYIWWSSKFTSRASLCFGLCGFEWNVFFLMIVWVIWLWHALPSQDSL